MQRVRRVHRSRSTRAAPLVHSLSCGVILVQVGMQGAAVGANMKRSFRLVVCCGTAAHYIACRLKSQSMLTINNTSAVLPLALLPARLPHRCRPQRPCNEALAARCAALKFHLFQPALLLSNPGAPGAFSPASQHVFALPSVVFRSQSSSRSRSTPSILWNSSFRPRPSRCRLASSST